MGGLGQELSGVSEVFRRMIEERFSSIAERLPACLEEARQEDQIPGRLRYAADGDKGDAILISRPLSGAIIEVAAR